MQLDQQIGYLESATTAVTQFANSEGNNIMTWIGFKHIMYAAEQSVLEHFRRSGLGIRDLFEQYGLLVEVVHNKGRILHALKLDEPVTVVVGPGRQRPGASLAFDITMFADRDGRRVKTYAGAVRVVLRRDASLGIAPVAQLPAALERLARDVAAEPAPDSAAEAPVADMPSLEYTMRIPYYYCHGNERLKMSGLLRIMEAADAEFCAQRGISIRRLLEERRWIPAVPSAEITILAEAGLEEDLLVRYQVVDVVKDLTYKSRLDCFVQRDGTRVHVATGVIVHAYAEIHSRRDWSMVSFDADVMQAIGA